MRLGRTLNVPHPTPLCTIHGCCVGILCPGLSPTQGLRWLSGDPGNLLWKQLPLWCRLCGGELPFSLIGVLEELISSCLWHSVVTSHC